MTLSNAVRNANVTVAAAVSAVALMFAQSNAGAQAAVLLVSFVVPGLVAMRRFGPNPLQGGRRLILALTYSTIILICVSTVLAVLPHWFGVAHPLSRPWVQATWSIVLLGCAWSAWRHGFDHVRDLGREMRSSATWWSLVLIITGPILALIGVAEMNESGNSAFAWLGVTFAVIAVISAVVAPRSWRIPRAGLLGSSVITVAYAITQRGGWLTWDANQEYSVLHRTITLGHFPIPLNGDPYAGMLSLTTLPAQLHFMTGLTPRMLLAVIAPMTLGVCVAAIYYGCRTHVSGRVASAVVAVVIGTTTLANEIPGSTRQCWAFMFFAVALWLLSERPGPLGTLRWVVAVVLCGAAVSHYNTAYLAVGAVLVAALGSSVSRAPKAERVITWSLAGIVTGFTILWNLTVAATGHSISTAWASLRDNGLRFLPSGGNPISRWLAGANLGKLQSAEAVRAYDLAQKAGRWHFINSVPGSASVPLQNNRPPVSSGIFGLSSATDLAIALIAQLVLLGAVIATVWLCYRAVRSRRVNEIAFMGVFGLLVGVVSRGSATIALLFSPSRVQSQMYLVFAVIIAMAIKECSWRPAPSLRPALLGVAAAAAFVTVLNAAQVTNLVIQGRALPEAYRTSGQQIECAVKPGDLAAARYVAAVRRTHLVEADFCGAVTLLNVDVAQRHGFIASLDPVLVDTKAVLLLTETNVDRGRARGATRTATGSFSSDVTRLATSRPVLYDSGHSVVLGPMYLPR